MEPDGDKATIVGCPSETVSVQFLWKRSIAGNWRESCIITRSPQSYVVILCTTTLQNILSLCRKSCLRFRHISRILSS